MTTERTITIIGREVRMRYCAATETGFERLRGKNIADIDFTSQEDMLTLAVCAIVSAYARKDEESPVSSEEILYEDKPKEIIDLIKNALELRAAWYEIPSVVPVDEQPKSEEDDEDKPKN